MRDQGHCNRVIADIDVRVMISLLGGIRHFIPKLHCRLEVRKAKDPLDCHSIALPAAEIPERLLNFRVCKHCHKSTFLKIPLILVGLAGNCSWDGANLKTQEC